MNVALTTVLNEDVQAAIDRLEHKILVTRSARFNACHRLSKRHRRSVFLTAILSLFVIVLSLLPNIFDLADYDNQVLLTLSIVNSVFIIIVSLMDGGTGYSAMADHLGKSGRDLTPLSIEISLIRAKKDPGVELKRLSKEYADICSQCPVDHGQMDYLLVKIKNPELFLGSSLGNSNVLGPLKRIYWSVAYSIQEQLWLIPPTIMILASLYVIFGVIHPVPIGT